ncbi:MAG: class I tRNA ligase family protein [Microthrixaceae bacterium]
MWFDAPIGYIAATKEWADAGSGGDDHEAAFRRWWRTDSGAHDVTYTQFMGKDNVPFHTLSFPATLLGSGEDWLLVDRLKSFNWLTYYGGKFSTSEGRGVFMSDALELLPADYWRWYLMANAPESDDASFTWELFGDAVNKDLVGTFGNFVNRAATQVKRHFGEVVSREARIPVSRRRSGPGWGSVWPTTRVRSTSCSSGVPRRRCGPSGPRGTSTWRSANPGVRSRRTARSRPAPCGTRCSSRSCTRWPRPRSCPRPPGSSGNRSGRPRRRRSRWTRDFPEPRVTRCGPANGSRARGCCSRSCRGGAGRMGRAIRRRGRR